MKSVVMELVWFAVLLCVCGANGWNVLAPDESEDSGKIKREVEAPPVTYREREEDRVRYVSYNELGELDRFSGGGVKSFRQLLFDPANYQVIVGARDHIYRLSLTGFHVLEATSWPPSLEAAELCMIKGQAEYACHNFITLLQRHGDDLLACGTHAFQPLCSWRRLSEVSVVDELQRGVGRSPFDPRLSSTYVMTSDGSLFVGTSNDFHGRDSAFMRTMGPQSFLRTSQYDDKWLSQPSFVASFENGGFVYFFFREKAVEYLNCGQRMYPRIGRVCKDDPGGSRRVADKWTTFLKARLDCSRPGQTPFFYDNLQSVAYLPGEEIFYGLFTTQENAIAGSALCAFNMTSVNRSFDGAFKYQSDPTSTWVPVQDSHDHYRCNYNASSHHDPTVLSGISITASKFQLMHTDVAPVDPVPVYTIDYHRLKHVAVDVVPTRQSGSVHVIYVSGEDGTVRKLSVVPRNSPTTVSNRNTPATCLLEVIAPFRANISASVNIHTLQFLRETNSVYLGTEDEVVRVPVHRCGRHRTRQPCLAAQDPYCGWDRNLLQCAPPPDNNPFATAWLQEVIDCPTDSQPIDGAWSRWSPWQRCKQSESTDSCQCRHRTCDAPKPVRGGKSCFGPRTEVSKCTVHGGWTAWSAWSQCSASCGIAVKSRRRSCTNPAPSHGGRVCVGLDHNEIYCHLLPPCPVSTHLPVAGGWNSWGRWSDCSAQCGEGTRRRSRQCNNPRPRHGGHLCPGCDEQIDSCTGTVCTPVHQFSKWTPWLLSSDFSSTGVQKRYRVQCTATEGLVSSQLLLDMTHEERYCSSSESCTDTLVESLSTGGTWNEWSNWSSCDRECGTGQQTRWRSCSSDDCVGSPTQYRACNQHTCTGHWGCWTDWSECSTACGPGAQHRSRTCIASYSPLLEASDCSGARTDQRACQETPCLVVPGEEGWTRWSSWSDCDQDDFRVRSRTCVSSDPSLCRGLDNQKQSCDVLNHEALLLESIQRVSSTPGYQYISAGALAGACVVCLLVGVLIGGVIVHTYAVRKRHHQVPSSPHYLNVKPNQYVTVPSKQWKMTSGKPERDRSKLEQQVPLSPGSTLKHSLKRQNSMRDPYTTLPLKEIDTATIKRSSHSSYGNGHLRADFESDAIFNF